MVNVGDLVFIVVSVGHDDELLHRNVSNYVISLVEVVKVFPSRIAWKLLGLSSKDWWPNRQFFQPETENGQYFTKLSEAKAYVLAKLQKEKIALQNRVKQIDEQIAEIAVFEREEREDG